MTTNTLQLKTDLSCESCVETLKPILDGEKSIHRWEVDLGSSDKVLTVQGENLTATFIGSLIGKEGYHVLGQTSADQTSFKTFYPLYLIFSYLIGFTFLRQLPLEAFDLHLAMNDFMGGFFIVFSFFKFLNLKGFVDAYATYDVLAKKVPAYGYLYVFLELSLGIAYLTHFEPMLTNVFTFFLMSFSSVGVIQSLVKKHKIQCACLGTIFKLPMTYVTVTEDLLMAGMALLAIL